jgi:N-acetylglucosamine-6-sulfatase
MSRTRGSFAAAAILATVSAVATTPSDIVPSSSRPQAQQAVADGPVAAGPELTNAAVLHHVSPHPNVIVMMVDDATFEDIAFMPNVQALLVRRGTSFSANYSPFSLCCPARATVLTGQYPHNHGVLDNVPPLGGSRAFDPSHTIATYLSRDYRTGLIGKYLNGFRSRTVPPGWSVWRVPLGASVYNYLNQDISFNGTVRSFRGVYSTTHLTRLAGKFIRSSRRPFFLYLSWVAPHDGFPHETADDPISPYVAPRYRDTYSGPSLPDDASVNEADMSDKRPSFRDRPLLGPGTIANIKERLAQRRESLRFVDDGVASLVQTVADAGDLGRTYFLFMSDNGQFQGQHRIAHGKSSAYQPASHVPLIIRGPGIPTGATYERVTGLQDITPTILSMTREWHGSRLAQIDGMNLLPLVRGSETSRRPEVLEATVTSNITDAKAARGVRLTGHAAAGLLPAHWYMRGIVTSDGWKYTVYPQTHELEVYNLNTDPNELENRAGDPSIAARQAALRQRYLRYRSCDGAGCR